MNFTREPIIETVITPREGCKLVVRNSKGNGQEDYFVDAIEVVSFGHSFFFRSQERPKSFLVPVSDYEILELKETRMVLKNVSTDRSIKIGGGREAPRREEQSQEDVALSESRPAPDRPPEQRSKRDKRRRNRRGRDRGDYNQEAREQQPREQQAPSEENFAPVEEASPRENENTEEVKAPSFISKLFPPPPTLIKDSIGRYKTEFGDQPSTDPKPFDETIFEHPQKELEDDDEE